MTHKIHLTYPSSLTDADAEALMLKYRELHPDRYNEWVEIEKLRNRLGPHDLAETQVHFYRFLREHTTSDSHIALSSAWMKVRKFVVRAAYSH